MAVIINDFEIMNSREESRETEKKEQKQEEPGETENEESMRRQMENLFRTWAH